VIEGSGDPATLGAVPGAPAVPAPHRVLIVDDSPSVRRALRETLVSMPAVGEVFEAVDGLDGLARLAREPVDLVITDVNMPRLDGFKFIAAVRNNQRFKDLMVIMLSAHGESVDKVRGLTIGANDYVTKPFERGELQARVTVMLKMKELQVELQQKNAALERMNLELERLANQDGLTRLPNRRYFFERFEVEFHRSRRLGSPLSVLMIDIDHFKSFNDRYGHQSGDEALRTAAVAIQGGIRTYDLAGRYGGEEFITYLPETGTAEALLVAERLRSSVQEIRMVLGANGVCGTEVRMTVSIGIANWPDQSFERVPDMVAAADQALYRAKESGRNRCAVASVAGDPPPTAAPLTPPGHGARSEGQDIRVTARGVDGPASRAEGEGV
jgi:diguanylate cyclase (GGDEF)-like protein